MTEEKASTEGETAPVTPSTANGMQRILESSGVAETVAEDPLVRFFVDNWRVIITVALAVGLGVLARSAYQRSQEASLAGAADLFKFSRETYETLSEAAAEVESLQAAGDEDLSEDDQAKLAAAQEKKREIGATLESNLKALRTQKEPYASLAVLYSGLASQLLGNTEAAIDSFQELSWRSTSGGMERLVAELCALNLARLYLDDADKVEDGKKLLGALASEGIFSNISAAIALSNLASSEEEKQAARALLETQLKAHPNQADMIAPVLEKLKV